MRGPSERPCSAAHSFNGRMRLKPHILVFLLCATQFVSHAASTQFYGLVLGRRYSQTNTTAPTILPTKGYESRAFLYATTTTTASIRKPNATTVNLAVVGDHLEATTLYDIPALLTSAWPLGNYTVNISNPTDGTKAVQMYIGGDFYPTPARVSNFVEAQAIFPGQNFALRWDGVTGPAPADLIQFQLEENGAIIFETPAIPGAPGALAGTATSVTIPGARLPEGRVFLATITAWRAVTRNTTAIVGSQGQMAYLARTTVPLRTRYLIQDVAHYGVEKRVMYEQSAATPTLRVNAYEMTSFLTASSTQSVTAATFRAPNGSTPSLTAAALDYNFLQAFASPAAMDGAFPAGAYEMRIATKNNGFRTNLLSLAGSYPQNPPQVANIDEAQYIKPALPFVLSWNAPEVQSSDLFQVIITEGTSTVFSTPIIPGLPGALNNAARSVSIPAGTFAVGKSYLGTIRHARIFSNDPFNYPLATGTSSHARVTRFPMQIAAGPSPQPSVGLVRVNNTQTELTFDSVRGEKYVIQTSTALPTWTSAPPITASGPTTTFRLPASAAPFTFYRLAVGP